MCFLFCLEEGEVMGFDVCSRVMVWIDPGDRLGRVEKVEKPGGGR